MVEKAQCRSVHRPRSIENHSGSFSNTHVILAYSMNESLFKLYQVLVIEKLNPCKKVWSSRTKNIPSEIMAHLPDDLITLYLHPNTPAFSTSI